MVSEQEASEAFPSVSERLLALSPPVIGRCLHLAALALADCAQATPRLEAELLLAEASGLRRTELYARPEAGLTPDQFARFAALLQRRLVGEPLAYLLGRWGFWTLELEVTPATLIPRPETELLVETALERLTPDRPLRIADLGTGSGAIAAALASERPLWHLIAVERSPAAMAIARDNFRRLGLLVAPVLGHWLSALGPDCLDAILSNPPYVAAGDPHLAGSLRFEPQLALVSGQDGLDAIRAILADAPRCLKSGGLLAVEHGYDQGATVRRLFAQGGLQDIETRCDLAGHERITLGYRAGQ
ncbi:peptide chain release factor N(5)-glutamine methyltransferase [Caldichromatium japonicum]|uniref:Release factor glutamine methyltransferase n=1 Tax=Caldichromatium japonicum TaxID=2699430 RepID=A0A6G7VAY9_9GAMM|nr:peptide chain release factor N(5)-glutamine methyltransferase [Caldichromatium japonicum]QIK37181.1 peptide chain release factor N(5)-glutamine methyltransferase [Caldichromatium japonicum]